MFYEKDKDKKREENNIRHVQMKIRINAVWIIRLGDIEDTEWKKILKLTSNRKA